MLFIVSAERNVLVKVKIDAGLCQGHGRCSDLAPGLFGEDEEGYGRVLGDPPYGKACSDHTSSISWYETDDGVPVELIESGLALASPFTCFSDELAQRDKTYLSKLSILSKAVVDYSGPFGD